MQKELAKKYEPKEVEDRIYAFWMENGYFHVEADPSKKPYTIVMPPPNVTGQLHMGHALDNTLQDILIRWRRMQGYAALWVPGTDHASIATEARIVAALKEEGVTKEEIGREKFLERAWAWKEANGNRIRKQLQKMGSSCDWQRERFTMDEGCSRAVNEVFVSLYDKGLIYRGERIINWCPHCKTSISDAEVEHEEKTGFFWHIRYPLSDGSGHVEIATTRPETLLGDTAVAVHPDDARYRGLIGKTLILPLVEKEIPIVADTYVDMEFGTGAVKITPAHDPNDFEVGLRHKLPVVNVMTDDGFINEAGGKYCGMDLQTARDAVVKDLEAGGYLIKAEPITHAVGFCYRCNTSVEPRVSKQWFVKMKPLAAPAIKAVRSGKIKMVPERFEKIYFHWMENIKDWCISRQLWWGHPIPAYYCGACGETVVSLQAPDACPKCGGHALRADEDTLDTWFSSALWPFSTLGWPAQTKELDYFYPTNTLVTGYDIIFFWVARMIISGLVHMKEVPFDTVLFHGIIRDAQGRKMSKSLGNGVDPLKEIETYGADALRFTLATGNSPGNDMRYAPERVEASRNFANKLWNAARFVLMHLEPDQPAARQPETLALEDKWILSKRSRLIREVTDNLERFELGLAVAKLYDFIWDVYCDWYIELAKVRLQAGGAQAQTARAMLLYVLDTVLKLLHPFMPFITEEIWQSLPHEGDAIMTQAWPTSDEAADYREEETAFEQVVLAIRAIRNRRSQMNVPPSKKARVFIQTQALEVFGRCRGLIERLASASEVSVGTAFEINDAVRIVTDVAVVYIPMDELVDRQAERQRLEKEITAAQKEQMALEAKLQNEGFLQKAPAAVVEAQRDQLAKVRDRLALLQTSLEALQ